MKRLHFALSLVALCSITFAPCVFADDPPTGTDSSEPMLKERIHINDLIDQARKRNIGVAAYVQQMEAIEDKAFNGAPVAELKPLIDSLTAKLNAQLQESVTLKNFRPAPLTAKQKHDLWKAKREGNYESDAAFKERMYRTKNQQDWGHNNDREGHSGSMDIRPHWIKSDSFTDGNISQKQVSDSRHVDQRSYSSTDMVLKDASYRKTWNSIQNMRASGTKVTGTIAVPRDPGKP